MAKRVLLTGMSATGKSTVVRELVARGYNAIDTDYDGWSHWVDLRTGLPASPPECGDYPWEQIVLLTAPVATILERLATRADNPYGTTPRTRARVVNDIETVEPLLRAGADFVIDTSGPLEEVVETVLGIVRG